MRNVTIVDSNVEPNKQHLWFYNGELKFFGPNGWTPISVESSGELKFQYIQEVPDIIIEIQ